MIMDERITAALFLILGLVIGSFLNVCVYRLPRGESVVFTPSHCPACGLRLGAGDLVPLLSYLVLKGRCRSCGARISSRYPLVELTTGLLFAAVFMRTGLTVLLLKQLFLVAVLIAVTFIDLEHMIIPDRIIVFSLAGGIFLNILAGDLSLLSAGLGLIAAAALLLAPALIYRGGMGGGDIKLAAVIGFFLGWPNGLLAVLLGCLLGALAGITLVLTGRRGRKDAIPFGPFLAGGALLAMFYGNQCLSWYLGFL
ncbi:MAG: Type 4 prepilin-like proteins leader peptide-processing enzyme [Firmicutes bacterium ADurb.Bin456]|nr:MAG: Type 4 prepilin-like proteins leader peptide-processing enzyme [Firmicutes bacterium ADurb.Bin456]